jgi:hypothetical protein
MRNSGQPTLFQYQELRNVSEFRDGSMQLANLEELSKKVSELELCKAKLLKDMKTFRKGRCVVLTSGDFSLDALRAIIAFTRGIADLQKLIDEKLDPVINSKKAAIAELKSSFDQYRILEPNYYAGTPCLMQ